MPNHDDLVSAAAGRKATAYGALTAARRGVNKALAASHAKPGNAALDTAVIAARSDVRTAMVASAAATAEWEAARDAAPSAGAVAVSKPAVVAAASPSPTVAKKRKSVSPAEAMRRFSKASAAIDGWKNNPAVRQLFASVVDFEKYLKGSRDGYSEKKLREGSEFAASLDRYNQAAKAGRARDRSWDLTPEEKAADRGRYPVVIEAKEFWNSSPKVRAEFHQNFDDYLGYREVQARKAERNQ